MDFFFFQITFSVFYSDFFFPPNTSLKPSPFMGMKYYKVLVLRELSSLS